MPDAITLTYIFYFAIYLAFVCVIYRGSKLNPRPARLVFSSLAPAIAVTFTFCSFKLAEIYQPGHIQELSSFLQSLEGGSNRLTALVRGLSLIAIHSLIPILGVSAVYNAIKYLFTIQQPKG